MSRVPPLEPDRFTPEQRRVYGEIAGARGGTVAGPFGVWMHQPRIADAANRFGNAVRAEGKLEKRLFELMVLTIARHWSAQYEWSAHEDAARKAGLPDTVIEDIRHHRAPTFARADEKLIHDVVSELITTRTLRQETYDGAVAALGLDLMIELVTAAGFYTVAAMMINAFDCPVPSGKRPLP